MNHHLEVKNLSVSFHSRTSVVRAVRSVSFTLNRGETLGIVGESGSGKSVSCYSILRLLPMPPARIDSGSVLFGGKDLLTCSISDLQKIRGKKISMIFQDPLSCLNPYLRIGHQLIEPLLIHEKKSKKEALKRAEEMLAAVGIQDAPKRLRSYPHEFSGGMRQRVMIAMALITDPEILIADEPTTALDVTVQAQILDLIEKMQKRIGMSVLFITHDLGIIAGIANRVLVMYGGQIVETANTNDLFYQTKHPYTRALLGAIPSTHKRGEKLYTIAGSPPDPSQPIEGCSFAPRCEFAKDLCRKGEMDFYPCTADHLTRCIRVQRGEIKLEGGV